MEIYRQGDVLIERIKSIPKGANLQARDNGRVVLARGEVTGHAHAIADMDALLLADDDGVYLEADGEITLRHEEHSPIQIPPGKYRVTIQREYAPEAIRNVAD